MYAEGTVVGGRYRLVRKIGEGGMATIWEAEHQTLGSPVAVKFLQWSGPQSEQIRERFLREARVAASVRHRNVVEITDFGLMDDKTPYIVMERLQGEILADIFEREVALPPHEAARLVSLTLRGLAVVHEKGIVHRDLKPENIFIVSDPDGSYPKLLDFGVSRRTEPAAKNLTQEGMLLGTPDYMSPEQARGLRDIDARTDIYSMGIILYEALSGRLPFESENIGDLIVMITTQPPTPITAHVPDLAHPLVEIVERAIAKDREQRFPTAREMRWALIEAFRGDSFGDMDSGVTSVSELPPPRRTGSFPQVFPGTPPQGATPPHGVRRAPLPTPSQPFQRPQLGGDAPQVALGAPPSPAVGSPRTPIPSPNRGRRISLFLGVVVGAVVLLAGGVLAYREMSRPEPPAREGVPVPWEPRSEGLPPEVTDGGPDEDAGETVRVRLYHLPDGGVARIETVRVEGSAAEVPAVPGSYRVEVIGPDGGTVWRTVHPGWTDGEYEVWPMAPAELEGGVPGEAVEEAAPVKTKRRRPPRRRRPRRR